jgi:hypothetical protein
MSNGTATPLQQPNSADTDFQALEFFVLSRILNRQTSTLVQVVAVTPPTSGLVGTIDVLPLVGQVDGAGNVTPHETIYNRPYSRVQGGANAIIMDPVVGDIGVMVFASRDISSVASIAGQVPVPANQLPAPPASGRLFSYADGLYLYSIARGTPTQSITFSNSGIAITTPHQVTITASGGVNINGAQISNAGEVTDALGKVLGTHIHGGVQTGGGTSGPPV